MIAVQDGVRIYTCSACEKRAEWGEGWKWRSADSFSNGVRRILLTCSEKCRDETPQPHFMARPSNLLTVKEFAEKHGVHPITIYLALGSGRVQGQKFGRAWAVPADASFVKRASGPKPTHRQKNESAPFVHQMPERTIAVMQTLLEYEGVTPHGALADVGKTFGLTRERIRQIAVQMGVETSGKPLASPVYLACATCGIRPVQGWRTGGVQCVECKKVPVACDYCGVILYREEKQVLRNALNGFGKSHTGAWQCNRAGKKRCPRGPVMFALQLTDEWQQAWISTPRYVGAVKAFAHSNGFRITSEKREDGYWMRRAE